MLRPVCPRAVPRAREEKGFGHLARTKRFGNYSRFEVEWGAPYRSGVNRRDRPPRFSHLVVHAGDLSQAFPFGWPGREDPPSNQPGGKDLGRRSWGEREGRLVLGPPDPFGGADSSHLIFRWRDGESEYALSLHAWAPLKEAEAALRRTVASLP